MLQTGDHFIKPNSLKVLVTDAHELSGLGAVRSLGRAGHTVIAGFPQGIVSVSASYSRYCRDIIQYPDPWKEQFAFREFLLQKLAVGNYDAVLPNSEAAIIAVASISEELPKKCLKLIPKEDSLRFTLSKYNATEAAIDAGISVPKTIFLTNGSTEDVMKVGLEELGLPIILKTDNVLLSTGEYIKGKTHIAFSLKEIERIIEQILPFRTKIIAQEYINGVGTGTFILRWNGIIHLKFAHLRIHEIPFWGGWSSLRCNIDDSQLINLAQRLLNNISFEGVAMVEFRRKYSNEIPYFLEINGRLWGSLALALHAGVDFPAALLNCYSTGSPDPDRLMPPLKRKIYCSNLYPGEILYLRSIFKRRPNQFPVKLPSRFRAVVEVIYFIINPMVKHDYLWWSDPFPAFIQIKNLIVRSLRKCLIIILNKLKLLKYFNI